MIMAKVTSIMKEVKKPKPQARETARLAQESTKLRMERIGQKLVDLGAAFGLHLDLIEPPDLQQDVVKPLDKYEKKTQVDLVKEAQLNSDAMRQHIRNRVRDVYRFRKKRQILTALGFLFGIGIGGYSATQAIELKKQLKESNNIIHHHLEYESRIIQDSVRNLNILKEAIQLVDKKEDDLGQNVEALRMWAMINEVTSTYEDQVDSLIAGVWALANDHLSPHLLEPAQVETAVEELGRQAKNQKKEVIRLNPYEYKFSVLAEEGTLLLMIHVPIIQGYYRLLKYVPIPILVQEGVYMQVRPEDESYLAIEEQGGLEGFVMSTYEADRCMSLQGGKLRLCDQALKYKDVTRSTCLGALYLNRHPTIQEKCTVTYRRNISHMYGIDHNRLLVISDTDQEGVLHCNGSKPLRYKKNEVQLVQVPPGCRLSNQEADFTAGENFHVQMPLQQYVHVPISLTWTSMGEKKHQEVQDALKKIREVSDSDLHKLSYVHNKIDAVSHAFKIGTIIFVAIMVAMIFFYFLELIRFKCRQCEATRLAPGASAMSQM